MQHVYKDDPSRHYCLNMQVLADELEARHVPHQFYNRGDPPALESIRFFRKGEALRESYVYLLPAQDIERDFRACERIHFIAMGEISPDNFSFTSSILSIPAGEDPCAVYNTVQQIFEKYAAWDSALQWAIQAEKPLDRMLTVSQNIFENPLFIHDTDFYILSCPRWLEGMLRWEKEGRTGREMVPMDLINEFKVDEEYLSSLKSRQVSMFSATIRGYRILFANLWSHDRYSGRVCVDELERSMRKSDYLHLEYLAGMIMLCMERQKLLWLSVGSDIDQFFIDTLEGQESGDQLPRDYLRYLDWAREDRYLVLKIASDREDYRAMTPAGLFGYIEAQIPEARAFLYHQDIAVIVNLTASKSTAAEVLSSLAYILREGLFKMGVSTELDNFAYIRDGYTQASVALEYGKNSGSMLWYFHFEDYALHFLLDCARRQIRPALLGSEKLRKLKQYDQENHTDFAHTLEVYLKLERNVVQTAKALFIHRSTLFYRLDRIQQLADVDYENERERLYLLLSYHLEKLDG